MSVTPLANLDGTLLEYTYEEMGTVRVVFTDGCISFDWLAGAFKGRGGKNFPYQARQVGEEQFFINWHEPESRGFVTVYADLKNKVLCSSVLTAYAADDEKVLFHNAAIHLVERS